MSRLFVTFRVDDHLLGVDVLSVREIHRTLDMTLVPLAPDYIRGLANLRGQIVTVFDLGVRLGLGPRRISPETHNLILKKVPVSLLVDDIGEVVDVGEEDMEPPPGNFNGLREDIIECVVRMEDRILVVVSADRIIL